jgi:hypothetical protein
MLWGLARLSEIPVFEASELQRKTTLYPRVEVVQLGDESDEMIFKNYTSSSFVSACRELQAYVLAEPAAETDDDRITPQLRGVVSNASERKVSGILLSLEKGDMFSLFLDLLDKTEYGSGRFAQDPTNIHRLRAALINIFLSAATTLSEFHERTSSVHLDVKLENLLSAVSSDELWRHPVTPFRSYIFE